MTYPASRKQIEFIRNLARQRVLGDDDQKRLTATLDAGIDTKQASRIIDWLVGRTEKPANPGYYVQQDGTMVLVVPNTNRTATYAKQLVNHPKFDGTAHWTWEYAPGVASRFAGLVPLSVEEAAKFGHLHGVCAICCHPLTDPKSVQRGLGPVCARKLREASW